MNIISFISIFFGVNYSNLLGSVQNEVMEHLAQRILKAFNSDTRENPSFLVVVVLPLKPEFPGWWNESAELQTIAYLNYATIKRADNSLFRQLKDGGSQLHDCLSSFPSVYILITMQ